MLGQPHFHVGDAPAHDLGFVGLRRKLALELADARAEVLHVAALFGEFLAGFLAGFLLARVAVFGVLHLPVQVGDLILQIVDLRLQRDDLDALAVRGRRRFGELRGRLGEFGFLVGEIAFGFAQRAGLGLKFVFGRAQLILDAAVARFEREDGRGLFAELDLEPVDDVVLLAEFGELSGRSCS